jgi:predicted nuclease with TOPRIM domain
METATKTQQEARGTDRVLEALSALAGLLDRTIHEVKGLDSDFQDRLLQAVHATEASLQGQAAQHLEQALTETRTKFEEQLKLKLAEMTAEWDAERTRLNGDLDRLTKSSAQWEAERSRLNGELERLSRVQAATQIEAEKALTAMKSMTASKGGSPVNSEAVTMEISRVEGLIKEISALIENPATELSTVIRKNVERAELESYLKGIRFAVNGAGSK